MTVVLTALNCNRYLCFPRTLHHWLTSGAAWACGGGSDASVGRGHRRCGRQEYFLAFIPGRAERSQAGGAGSLGRRSGCFDCNHKGESGPTRSSCIACTLVFATRYPLSLLSECEKKNHADNSTYKSGTKKNTTQLTRKICLGSHHEENIMLQKWPSKTELE